MRRFSSLIGAVFLGQQLIRLSADCTAIYFNFEDGLRRPIYPIDECATFYEDETIYSYQYECANIEYDTWTDYNGAIKAVYNGSDCKGSMLWNTTITGNHFNNSYSIDPQCDEDPCHYSVIKVSDECDDENWIEEMYVVNECNDYDDIDLSEEWTCHDEGIKITSWNGDDCFGGGEVNSTKWLTNTTYWNKTEDACWNTTSCDEWSIDCATENSALCAYCAQYAPCISSIDPHCITHEALGCLDCKHYAECAVCAPGWDNGCISQEWHKNYSCSWADLVVDNETITVPSRMDGLCHWNAIWESYMILDCATGYYEMDCNENCTNCSESDTFSPSNAFDVQITDPLNAVCVNYTETEDNETEYLSMFVYGHCTYEPMQCPDGNSCGPESCSTNTSSLYYDDYCIEIEVFDENVTCTAEVGAGNYTAYAIADNTCRMDGSGRSYYALECAEGVFYGVIGCLDCLCSDNCTDIVLANEGATGLDGYSPNTCYQYNVTDDLQIAGIVNETLLQCSQNRTSITIQDTCELTYDPTYEPTSEPTGTTDVPTDMPSNEPTAPPTDMPSNAPTAPPSNSPTAPTAPTASSVETTISVNGTIIFVTDIYNETDTGTDPEEGDGAIVFEWIGGMLMMLSVTAFVM